MKNNLDQISNRALELASKTQDPDGMLKAIQASAAASELREKHIEDRRFRNARSWATLLTPYTAVFALVLSVLTLASQSCQFRTATEQQERAAERAQWRDALKGISSKDDSSAPSAVFQMESFFDSSTYGTAARTISVTLLPYVGSEAAFDAAYYDLRMRTNDKNEKDLITIAQDVTFEDWKLFHNLEKANPQASFIQFVIDPEPFIPERGTRLPVGITENQTVNDNTAGSAVAHEEESRSRALRYSWEIDTVSRELSSLWKDPSKNPGPAKIDLNGLILEKYDFRSVDFSGSAKLPTQLRLVTFYDADLTGANFENTALDQTSFTSGTKYSGTKWQNANWWDAKVLPCKLGRYLQENYPVPSNSAEEEKARSESLIKTACDEETVK